MGGVVEVRHHPVKRTTLFAALAGALLVGGGIYGLTRAVSSSSSSSSSSSASTEAPPSTTQTGATPTERPSLSATPATSTSPSTASSSVDPAKGGGRPTPAPISPEAAARAAKHGIDPAAAAAAPRRTGETQIHPLPRPDLNPPLSSEDEAVAREKRFKRTLTKAACTAPDIGERLAQMPAEEGRKLIERCAAAGITVTAAKR